MKLTGSILALIAALSLVACGGEKSPVTPPPPALLTEESTGYYCGMFLVEHEGPKAQVFLAGETDSKWFSQVRDAIHFLHAPEENADAVAFYVTDMSAAGSGAATELPWIAASDAFFVIDSQSAGGMGAPETIPFSSAESAARFVAEWGGKIVRLDEIPQSYVLAPYGGPKADMKADMKDEAHAHHE